MDVREAIQQMNEEAADKAMDILEVSERDREELWWLLQRSDYTKWREQYLDEGVSVRELSKKAEMYSKSI